MTFSPNKVDFKNGMEMVVKKLEETVLCVEPLIMDPLFYPFTRPILYGKQEDSPLKSGPSLKNVLENDVTTRNQIVQILQALQESFKLGTKHLEHFEKTRENYKANETMEYDQYLAANNDAEFFRSILANLKDQMLQTKNITEYHTLGIFKLNFTSLKRKASPAIAKCIDKLYTLLPKLSRNKMDTILKECQKNKNCLDFRRK